MTDVQINEAIALHLGWRGISSDPGLGVMGIPPTGNECDIPRIKNAMWTKDLNAMHEAEKLLNSSEEKMYFANLEEIVGDLIWYRDTCRSYRATARERAEAFLRALGKWEEVQG